MSSIDELREKLNNLTPEQLEKIGGGDCTPLQWMEVADRLQETYDTLVDLTSHVIERVVGP